MKNLQVLDAVETLSQLSQVSDKSHPELLPRPERIKKAFSTLNTYLSDLYSSDQMLLKNHDYLASLKAVMIIAEEAYDKLDLVSKIFHTTKQDLGQSEFNHLYDFYLKKVNYKVEHVAGEVFRHSEEEKKRALTDTHGLKNLEVIRKDSEYELFYIKDEEGLNHFSKNLLRHTQLLGTFDELFLTFQGEDPFIKLKFIEDRVKQKRALLVREMIAPRIDYFLKEAFRFKKQPFISQTCSMLNALFLSSYPALVLQNDPNKACFEYFNDMMMFINQAVSKPEFFKSKEAVELLSDKGILASQRFISGVVFNLFLSKNDIRYVAEHLYQFVDKPKTESYSPYSFFDKLLEFDKSLRAFLSNFPSGPLMKALDFIKDSNKPVKFEPIRSNLPQNLFNLIYKDKQISCINMGSPTTQENVRLALIDPLFEVFKSQLEGQSTLMINLEDPHSSYAEARISALNNLASNEMTFSCIPRNGFFYQQLDEYAFIDEAAAFKELFLSQFEDDRGANYTLSSLVKRDIAPLFEFVHEHIFENKKTLNLKDRLVFIEIMQVFMGFKLVEKFDADNLIVVCKDGIDHSNIYMLSMMSMVHMIHDEMPFSREGFDFFISEIYGPSMTLRDRPIFEESLVRMCSALSYFQSTMAKNQGFLKALDKVLPILKSIKVKKS